MPSPTARSLKYYRDQGFMAAVVEKWIQARHIRMDLFGVFDLLIVKPNEFWGVQCSTMSHIPERIRKMKDSALFSQWILFGGKAAVLGWAKQGARGKRKIWTSKEQVYNPVSKEFEEHVKDKDSEGNPAEQAPYFP